MKSHFKIINVLSGFQNSYDASRWQVWTILDDGRSFLCEICRTKKQAQDYIKNYKNKKL